MQRNPKTAPHILTLTSLYPNSVEPGLGIFIQNRMLAYKAFAGIRFTVVAPVPFFPDCGFLERFLPAPWKSFFRRRFASYLRLSRVPRLEWQEEGGRFPPAADAGRGTGGSRTPHSAAPGAEAPRPDSPEGLHPVYHPRYPLLPRISMRLHGFLMARSVLPLLRRIHRRHPIDLIDCHYVYPDGSAGLLAARRLGIPFTLSARGTDLLLFSRLPAIRPLLRRNLEGADAVVCVSEDLKKKALEVAPSLARPGRVFVVQNGISAGTFPLRSQGEARRLLGLPAEGLLLFSAGRLVPHKGFSLLLRAVAGIPRPLRLFIAGEGPERAVLERSLTALESRGRNATVAASAPPTGDSAAFSARPIQGSAAPSAPPHFRLLGALPQYELALWLCAADLFVYASEREGYPNVIVEALSCGLPVVSTTAGGIGEVVRDAELGILVSERSETALRAAIERGLDRLPREPGGAAREEGPAGLRPGRVDENRNGEEADHGLRPGMVEASPNGEGAEKEALARKPWDRARIAARMRSRTWETVAREMDAVFCACRPRT